MLNGIFSNMPAVSIITPVYNTEKYLSKCLDSIQKQTFTDFEVILIDDGSTDSSPRILDDYAEKEARFKVFHKKNKGVTAARKTGIQYASGEYIVWVDSDDWIEKTHLEQLYRAVTENGADICVCNFVKESRSEITKYKEIIKDLSNPISALIEENTCRGCLYTKISRRTLYTENNLFPPQGINCWEDVIISANLYYYSKRTVHIPIYTYHVNDTNSTSLTRSITNKKNNDIDKINVIKYFENESRFKDLDLSVIKYDVKYYIFQNSYMKEKNVPKEFYRLFSDMHNFKSIIKVLKNENVDSAIRFLEFFLVLSNLRLFAVPLHGILAMIRAGRTEQNRTEQNRTL